VLTSDFSTFNASSYGALLLLDPEEDFMRNEAKKLHADVLERGLGLVIAADWHDWQVMADLYYRDDSARPEHYCATGGANVPAINRLLQPFGVSFVSAVYHGSYIVGGRRVGHYAGSAISTFPAGGLVNHVPLKHITAEAAMSKRKVWAVGSMCHVTPRQSCV
jgi:membrane-bound transcription factor site-1 protease